MRPIVPSSRELDQAQMTVGNEMGAEVRRGVRVFFQARLPRDQSVFCRTLKFPSPHGLG